MLYLFIVTFIVFKHNCAAKVSSLNILQYKINLSRISLIAPVMQNVKCASEHIHCSSYMYLPARYKCEISHKT